MSKSTFGTVKVNEISYDYEIIALSNNTYRCIVQACGINFIDDEITEHDIINKIYQAVEFKMEPLNECKDKKGE